MIEPKGRELRAVRIEVAIKICQRFPDLYCRVICNEYPTGMDKEHNAYFVLKSLMEIEPCIRNILSFYYKRTE